MAPWMATSSGLALAALALAFHSSSGTPRVPSSLGESAPPELAPAWRHAPPTIATVTHGSAAADPAPAAVAPWVHAAPAAVDPATEPAAVDAPPGERAREEERASQRRALESLFGSEAPDEAWAHRTASELEVRLVEAAGPSVRRHVVSCKESVCRAEVVFDDEKTRSRVAARLDGLPTEAFSSAAIFDGEDAARGAALVVFLARQGRDLPSF